MSLQIKLTDQSPDINGNVYAIYRDNSGNEVSADIKVYINGTYSDKTPIIAKLDWLETTVCKLTPAHGKTVHVEVKIMLSGTDDVSMSHDLIYRNYKKE